MNLKRGVNGMKAIMIETVQKEIETFKNCPIYFHLEFSMGSYIGVDNQDAIPTSAYIRNGKTTFSQGKIVENNGINSVGLQIEDGWIYAQGLTDWEKTVDGKLLLAGHDQDGNLTVGLQLSHHAFE